MPDLIPTEDILDTFDSGKFEKAVERAVGIVYGREKQKNYNKIKDEI